MAQDEQRNKRSRASKASEKPAKANEQSELSGEALRRALDQRVLDPRPGIAPGRPLARPLVRLDGLHPARQQLLGHRQ